MNITLDSSSIIIFLVGIVVAGIPLQLYNAQTVREIYKTIAKLDRRVARIEGRLSIPPEED